MLKLGKNDKFWLSISGHCNNQCIFCHDVANQAHGSYKSLVEVQEQISSAYQSGAKRLILSGGEASINPNFIEVVKYAHDLGFQEIQTITNGRYFYYPKFVQEAITAGLTEVTFSLHGHNARLHDTFTGVKGSFDQALAGLKNVRRFPQVIVNIDIVINKLNYKYLPDIIKYYSQNFGVFEFDLLLVVPFGRAWENRQELFFDLVFAQPYLNQVWEIAKNDKRFHIWTNRFPAQYLEGYEFLIQDPIKMFDDVLGRQKMFSDFLNHDIMMSCHDQDRCRFCNLADFCQKLIELNRGEIKEKLDKLIISPPCLNLGRLKYEIDFLNEQNKIDLEKFVNFYIAHLYDVKSLRCEQCLYEKKCQGANINLIREKGFEILQPIK